MSREAAYSALFVQVAAAYPWGSASRRMRLWSDVPPSARPALFQLESGPETYVWTTPATPRRTFEAKLFLYFDARDPSTPGATAINNALDALIPHQGHIQLRSRESRNHRTGKTGITLTIADNGSGMSPQTLDKLFHPFFTTKGVTGTGLGLWVSREIVARHCGELNVRSSQSPTHRGTVFTLFLPFEAVTR